MFICFDRCKKKKREVSPIVTAISFSKKPTDSMVVHREDEKNLNLDLRKIPSVESMREPEPVRDRYFTFKRKA